MRKTEPGRLIVVSGASGSGKSTVLRRWLDGHPEVFFSLSATTRPPRAGELDGTHYRFMTREAFQRDIDEGRMLEWAEYAGNLYGTPAGPVAEALSAGRAAVLEIDVQGAMQVTRRYPQAVLVYVRPGSFGELERRLRLRATESEDVILRRLDIARGEYAQMGKYAHQVVNDDLDDAVEQLERIYDSVRRNA